MSEPNSFFSGRAAKRVQPEGKMISTASPASMQKSKAPLKFRIDMRLYEQLRSSGLSVKVNSGDFARSYLLAECQSESGFKFSPWMKEVAETAPYSPSDFFYSIPYHILEVSLTDKELFKAQASSLGKKATKIDSLSNGALLGFLSFNEHHADHKWIDAKEIFVSHQAQSLGIGSILMKCVSAIGFYSNKRGIEYDNILSLDSQSFYEAKGLTIIDHSSKHPKGCAQIKFRKAGALRVIHEMLPKPETFPPELKNLSKPEVCKPFA